MKHAIVLFEKFKILPLVTFPLLWISNLTARKILEMLNIAETESCMVSGLGDEVKIVFTDNPSQNMLRTTDKIK